jgi:ABC-type branched-subunit amino acid transport system permease subunit
VKRWGLIAVALVALALPYATEPIVVHTAIEILIMALFAMSFNLLFDGAGLLTLVTAATSGSVPTRPPSS